MRQANDDELACGRHVCVEDEGWQKASDRYVDFLRRHANEKVLLLELGVGFNTPGIVKYSFWRMTAKNKEASLCLCEPGRGTMCQKEIEGTFLSVSMGILEKY